MEEIDWVLGLGVGWGFKYIVMKDRVFGFKMYNCRLGVECLGYLLVFLFYFDFYCGYSEDIKGGGVNFFLWK